MPRRKTEPFVPHLYKRRIKIRNKKKEDSFKTVTIFYIWWTDEDGVKHTLSTQCTSKTKAEAFMIKAVKDDALGKKTDSITLEEFARPFFIEGTCPILKSKNERKVSYSKDFAKWTRGQIDKHLLPHLGKEKLEKLSTFKIQEWLNALPRTDKLSNKSSNSQLSFLRQILGVAVLQEKLKTNPCDNVKLLAKDSKTRPAFTEEEVKTLFSSEWDDIFSYTACMVASVSGLRISEVRALKPCNIKDGLLEIKRSYGRSGEKSTKNGKTRIVPVDKETQRLLAFVATGKKDDQYIFSMNGIKPMENRTIYASLYKEMEKRGIDRNKYQEEDPDEFLPLSFHSFRHTLNTLLLDRGIPQSKVMAVIGHLSPNSTRTYTNAEAFDLSDISKIQTELNSKPI